MKLSPPFGPTPREHPLHARLVNLAIDIQSWRDGWPKSCIACWQTPTTSHRHCSLIVKSQFPITHTHRRSIALSTEPGHHEQPLLPALPAQHPFSPTRLPKTNHIQHCTASLRILIDPLTASPKQGRSKEGPAHQYVTPPTSLHRLHHLTTNHQHKSATISNIP